MKNKSSLKIIALSSLFATLVMVGGSLSWFAPLASVGNNKNPITGEVEDEYYASGTGSANDPFVITKPRHLYNLAWLQYLGFYNKNSGVDNHQFYFKLGANIDMGEFGAIPPIGSELNPFVGNFNGQGYVISNVTISNSFDDYNVHPSAISAWDNNTTHKQPHILGLFGVIGEYPGGNKNSTYSTIVNEFVNTGVAGATIKTVLPDSLVGIAAGYVRDSVTSDTHNVLKNVVVDDSKISLPTSGTTSSYGSDVSGNSLTNISNYSLVGYTNDVSGVVKASKTTYGINIDTNIVFSATEEGNSSGWGGSVNMLEMYTKLDTIWKGFKKEGRTTTGVEAINYYANKEVYYDKQGNLEEDRTVESNPTPHHVPYAEYGAFSGSGNNYHSYYNYEQSDSSDGKVTSSYGFIIEENTSNEENFMCLSGNKIVTIQDGQSLTTHDYGTYYGKKISKTVNGTTYYLMKNNANNDVTVTTDAANATLWNIENNEIFTAVNDVAYYLNRSGTTTVNLSTSSNTVWNYNSTSQSYYTVYNNTAYFLNCSTTDWNLETGTLEYYLLSDGNGHYITHPNNNGNAGTGTNANDTNARWYIDNNRYKTSNTGTAYYLRNNYTSRLNNNSSSTQNMYVSNSTDYAFTLNDESYLYTTYYNNRNHYVYAYYNGTTWMETVCTGSRNPPANRTVIVREGQYTAPTNAQNITLSAASSTGTTYARTRTEDVDATVEVNHTYFPLRQADNKAGVPDDTNTGYVVSGGNYWGDPYGDIRVSKYSKSQYLSGGVKTVYTIDASGRSTTIGTTNSFKKYTEAKASMQTVLSSDSNVYGLHFMDASIHYGGTNPVIVEKAVVNGDTHYNYELPTDCVDFNLKENGYINFFAGTYYTGNSCFFSLHEVVRSGSSISEIKEIKGVYSDASDTAGVKSYSYLYSDGKYSVPFKYSDGEKVNLDGSAYVEHSTQNSCPTGYTLAFDTFRITNRSSSGFTLTNNVAYYFEIPMNEGEYCLGSVSGRNGAYLMYLDIAANAAKTNRTVFYEKFTLTQSTYSYPTGVSLGDLPSPENSATVVITTDVDDSDSACMVIKATATGVYVMERSANDVALTRAQTTNAPPNYCGDTIELIHDKGSSTALTVQAISSNSYVIKQVEYYDYMIISDTLLVTRITDYSTDGGNTYTNRTITQIKYGGNTPTGTPKGTYVYDASKGLDQRSDMRIYDHNNSGKRVSDADLIKTTVLTIPNTKLSSTVILVYKLFQNGGDAYDDVFVVIPVSDSTLTSSGTFFTYNGMTITLTPDSGSIIVKVTDYTSTFTIKVTNITANTSSNKNVNTSITINGTAVTGSQGQTITITNP